VVAIIFAVLALTVGGTLVLWRAPLWVWSVLAGLGTLALKAGSAPWYVPDMLDGLREPLGWAPATLLIFLSIRPLRRALITARIYRALKGFMPRLSSTEKEALEAGTVGFDAELFSGRPDWAKLRAVPPMSLRPDEQAFIDGPVAELCRRLSDWDIRYVRREVPEDIWDFVKHHGFLGLNIAKEHGGLGFSPQAQSIILGLVTSRSPDVGVVVMVPNSLGPGELIEKFGTKEQQDHYLPRLARGEEVPCFALTGPFAGSDAASMRDAGIVCRGEYRGRMVTGVKLSWDKRYITLAPNATLIGLAFRLFDPDGLLGTEKDLGPTLALVSTDEPSVHIGRRHLPCGNAFPNGPTWGQDVFVPLDAIIGGAKGIGRGWQMVMNCLAAGRAISLPATGTAGAKGALRVSGAYARLRRQFGLSIGRMEGVEERLARIAEAAYLLEAGRAVTASMVGRGEKPSVISALMKYQATEWARRAINDAMDIHGGKAICDGPSNYLQAAYQAIPVGITVEGANILTRSLMVFGQGAIRSHPYLYREIASLGAPDSRQGLRDFQAAFEAHTSFMLSNLIGAPFHNLTGGLFAKAPPRAPLTRRWYKQLSRAARNFALVADLSVAALGGGLKTRQRITGRLADALSDLYLLSCVLKRFEDDNSPRADLPLVELCVHNGLHRFYTALNEVIRNFPNAVIRRLLKVAVFPFGVPYFAAGDRLSGQVARLVQEPGEQRERLTRGLTVKDDTNEAAMNLEAAFVKAIETEEIARKIDRAERQGQITRILGKDWVAEARIAGIVTADEAARLEEAEALIAKVIAVDHFDPSEITGRPSFGHNSRAAAAAKPPHAIQAAE
jgi:acyl-CoA dehydrogenase